MAQIALALFLNALISNLCTEVNCLKKVLSGGVPFCSSKIWQKVGQQDNLGQGAGAVPQDVFLRVVVDEELIFCFCSSIFRCYILSVHSLEIGLVVVKKCTVSQPVKDSCRIQETGDRIQRTSNAWVQMESSTNKFLTNFVFAHFT